MRFIISSLTSLPYHDHHHHHHHYSAMNQLLDSFPDDQKRKDGRSWLPLHWAAALHDTEPTDMKGKSWVLECIIYVSYGFWSDFYVHVFKIKDNHLHHHYHHYSLHHHNHHHKNLNLLNVVNDSFVERISIRSIKR